MTRVTGSTAKNDVSPCESIDRRKHTEPACLAASVQTLKQKVTQRLYVLRWKSCMYPLGPNALNPARQSPLRLRTKHPMNLLDEMMDAMMSVDNCRVLDALMMRFGC